MDQVNHIPIQVLIDVVHPSNKWELVNIQNQQTNRFIIKKGIYYYDINDFSLFRNFRYSVKPSENVTVSLGEFRPLLADMMYLSLLPISFNGNEYIVNIRTKIVYIKPKTITLMLPKNTEYNFEQFKDYFYGGIFHQYLNSENHTGQLFVNMIPSNTTKPIPNNFQNQFNKQLMYDQQQKNKSLLGDKLLMKNDYVAMREPQKFSLQKTEVVTPLDKVTFLVPFLEKHSANYEQLIKTLWSIVHFVPNKEIFVVTNKTQFELPSELVDKVKIYYYKHYVGTQGYENRLNVMMKNGYDLSSFYNTIINALVRTDSFTMWQYNWELYDQWNVSEVNAVFPIYNYYRVGDQEYRSKSFVYGVIVDNKKRYVNTGDFMNVYLPGIQNVISNIVIPVKNIYSEVDYMEIKNQVTYESNKEVKDFYEKIQGNVIPEYIMTSNNKILCNDIK